MAKKLTVALAGTSLLAVAISAPAMAQNTPAPKPTTQSSDSSEEKEIVVTGTQIRNATPAGQTLLTTTAAQNEEQGATNGGEILAQIPQAANVFQNLPSIGGGGSVGGTIAASRLSFSSITLRNLPNFNTGAGEFTLQLVDGHRMVPIGSDVLGGQGTDPSTIPASLIQSTDIMPDGGSAIYGSNAVAGVINYQTRDKFDGLRIQMRGGLAGDKGQVIGDSYWQYDVSATGGLSWDSGSVFGSVGYSKHDALFGYDRDYIHAWDANPNSPLYQMPLGLNCDSPNIAITSAVSGINSRRLYPLTGINGSIQPFTTNGGTNGSGSATNANGIAGGNRCDSTDYTAIYPKSDFLNVAGGITQEISDSLKFSVKGMWSRRRTTAYQALNLTATLTPATPGYRPVCTTIATPNTPQCGVTAGYFAGDDTRNQSVTTNYGSVLPRATNAFVNVRQWQVTPQLTWDFANDWQARLLASYGESLDEGITGGVDNVLQGTRIASGLINPYNLPGSGSGAFTDLIKYDYRAGRFNLLDVRLVTDGPLPFLHAPGGDIRVALGSEYTRTKARQLITGNTLSPTPGLSSATLATNLSYVQTVKSVFGEIAIPLIGPDNDITAIRNLDLSGSVRYDRYNDTGGTWNYMAGATWTLTQGMRFRANFNTSYAAPNLLAKIASATGAQLATSNNNAGGAPLAYFQGFIPPGGANGGQAGTASQGQINQTNPIGIGLALSNGTVKDIGPQTSKTLSFGFEFAPPPIPGLTLSGSYYNLKISNAIGSPFQPNAQSLFDFHPELVYCHGGVRGSDANAKTACAIPMTIAELQALGFLTAADPNNINSVGLVTAATLAQGGISGAFGNIDIPTLLANYCGSPGTPGPAGTWTGAPGACPDVTPNPPGTTATTNTYTVFWVADNRSRNLGFIFSRGIDFTASYRTNVPWGSIDGRVTGTLNLATKTQAGVGAAVLNTQLTGVSKFRMTANLGTNWGDFRAQATWQHSEGYDLAAASIGTVGTATLPGTGAYGQTHVGDYDTFDLFFRYDFDKWGGMFKGLTATLNVNNFLDLTPPRQGGGYANGTTLGRLWQFGLTKDF